MTKTTDTLESDLKFMSGERLSKAQIGDIIGKNLTEQMLTLYRASK